ncbi:uncharacterized protein LOC100179285 isoform X2 [Ciona intestinalis]
MFKKRLFKKNKKSASEVGSLASGKSSSGYEVSPRKDLGKLHKAAFEGNLTKLKSLLKKGDVNLLDKENRTPLHLACANGKIDAVKMLVDYPNCNLNLCDNDRRSALMKCVQCQYQNCMNILLQKGADISLSDVNGNTALHLAVSIPSVDLCYLLLDYSADVHAKNKDGSTPLHIAATVDGSEDTIKLLLDDGAQINSAEGKGKTPLMLAASRGNLDIVKTFLSKGADATIRDKHLGWTADQYASVNGHHPISHIIVEHTTRNKSRPASSGSLRSPQGASSPIYSTVAPSSARHTPTDIVDHDTSQEDDTPTPSESDAKSLSDTSESDSPPEKAQPAKPKLNVAQFLKQRELMKQNQSTGSVKTTNIPTKVEHQMENSDDSESEEEKPPLRARGYQSKSQKIGSSVSPAKPPLPKPQTSQTEASSKPPPQEDDSPWDTDDEDEKEEGEIMKKEEEKVSSKSKGHSKPDANMLASLGFSADEVHDVYGDRGGDSDSTFDSQSQIISSKHDHVNGTKHSDHDLWDDDEHEQTPVHKNITDTIFTVASDYKFDDELSEDGSVEALVAPTNIRRKVTPEIKKENKEEEREEDSSSWDSDDVQEKVSPQKQSPSTQSPFRTSAAKVVTPLLHNNEDDDVTDSESESSWEVEAKNKRKPTKEQLEWMEEQEKERERELQEKEEEKRKLKALAVEASERHVKKEREKKEMERKEKEKREKEKREKEKKEREEKEKKDKEKRKREEKERMEAKKVEEERERIAREEKIRKKKLEEETLQNQLQEREKLQSALQDALNDDANLSESDESELDDSYMGNTANASKDKMGDIRTTMSNGLLDQDLIFDPMLDVKKNGRLNNHLDLDNLTTTETETEDEVPGDIPASLRSSQLSESLLRSGERGELEREAAKEKRRAINALEKLEFYKKENNELKEQIKDNKRERDHFEKGGSEKENNLRKLTFDLNRAKDQLQTLQLDLNMKRDDVKRLSEKLEIEGSIRRQQEINLRDIRGELKNSEQSIKKLEQHRNDLLNEMNAEKQKVTIREKVDQEKQKIQHEMNEDMHQDRRVQTLNMLMMEREQELSTLKADRDSLSDTCKRYKEELTKWRNTDADKQDMLVNFNEELNNNVDELTKEVHEYKELLTQCTFRYKFELDNLNQANKALTEQLKKERNEKEISMKDLETLNEQQRELKRVIDELRSTNQRKEDQLTKLNEEINEARQKREISESKQHAADIACNLAQHEANTVRTTLTHKETLLAQLEREREELKEQVRRSESEKSEMQRENARLDGRVELLQADVSQQESERARLRRELEDSRNFGITNMNSQQGKFSDIVSEHHTERLEYEKQNVKLKQQVAHLSKEIEQIREEKNKKEESLALAQQDVIDTDKKLHFTDSSMKQLAESQRHLQEEKERTQTELQLVKAKADSMLNRVEELSQLSTTLRRELDDEKLSSSNLQREVQSLQAIRSHDQDNLSRLEATLRESEVKVIRLQSDLTNSTRRESESKDDHDVLTRSRMQMEQLIGRLQEEKGEAERKLQSQEEKCRLLQSEADGHRQMWETEVKTRSKLSVDYARMEKEKQEAYQRMETSHRKLAKVSGVGKEYKIKYEDQKRRRIKLEDRIESMSDSSISEAERERDEIKLELQKLRRTLKQNGKSPSNEVVNAQITQKLDQVNNWLEHHEKSREQLEQMRRENEEKRLMEEKSRVASLERELSETRSRSLGLEDSDMTRRLQEKVRENISLHENLRRTKQDLEEHKVKLNNERTKYQSLYISSSAGNATPSIPRVSAFNVGMQNGHSQVGGFTSTPRKDLSQPYLSQFRNKLEASISQCLADTRPHSASPILDGTGSYHRKPGETSFGRSTANDYFVP